MQIAAGADGADVLLRRADALARACTGEENDERHGRQRQPGESIQQVLSGYL
jgi:hypothetical protein